MISENTVPIKLDIEENSESKIDKILQRKIHNLDEFKDMDFGRIWSSHAFGLDRVTLFKEASESEKFLMLEMAAQGRLEEAYHIEKSGMAYTAKMTLLSRNIKERQLYSIFSAEEARHFSCFDQIVSQGFEKTNDSPFLKLLEDVISNGARQPLIFIIQVLLEGWGIDHYQSMYATCQHDAFKDFLLEIIKDEAGHHGSGLMLFDAKELTNHEKKYILDILYNFLGMVQVGALEIVDIVEKVKGHLSRDQKLRILRELNSYEGAQSKLNILKGLMAKSNCDSLIEDLEKKGYFDALGHGAALG